MAQFLNRKLLPVDLLGELIEIPITQWSACYTQE